MNPHLIKHYRALELTPFSSFEKVRQAHRELSKVWHTDRFTRDPVLQKRAQERQKEINHAFEELKKYFDEVKRNKASSSETRGATGTKGHSEKSTQGEQSSGPKPPPPPKPSSPPEQNSRSAAGCYVAYIGGAILVTVIAFMGDCGTEDRAKDQKPTVSQQEIYRAPSRDYSLEDVPVDNGDEEELLDCPPDDSTPETSKEEPWGLTADERDARFSKIEKTSVYQDVRMTDLPYSIWSNFAKNNDSLSPSSSVSLSQVDINGDGIEEVFVTEIPGFCGAGGCEIKLFRKERSGYREFASFFGFEVRLENSRTNGVLDIILEAKHYKSTGGFEFVKRIYRWNGINYVEG